MSHGSIPIGVLLLALLATAGCAEFNRELRLVTPELRIDKAIAEAFVRQFDEEADIRIVLVDNPDPDRRALDLLKTGEADLALAANIEAYDPDIATVVPLYPTVLHIAYRLPADGSMLTQTDLLAELTQRRVFAGPVESPSRLLLETTLRRNGIDPARINYVDDDQGCADVIVIYAPVIPDLEKPLERCGRYRLFSMGDAESVGTGSPVDSIPLFYPHLKPFVIPAGTYGEVTPEPVLTLAVDQLLVARKGVPEGTIYDLLREILRLKPSLATVQAGLFQRLTDQFDVSGSTFVLHPGALAYLNRDEPDFYERYSGVAEVLVTLIIGLVSGLYAVYRILVIRRKNRIDEFYRQALELRDQAVAIGSDPARTNAVASLKALQERAYAEMINERLAADESFRIFITLSNDLMADLSGVPRSGPA
ncbi:MAG: TAXI family TRAP transporter solute-binding subunit [Pseudomonadales bacterium]